MLLAEYNGLAAARANHLPQYQRLKVLGDYFIIQQCASRNITVGMKMTRCGHEPIYKNFPIGKDGFFYTHFKAVFGKTIQSLFMERRIDGLEKNGRKSFPRFIWRLCILLNDFRTSKTKRPDMWAPFWTHLRELSMSRPTQLTRSLMRSTKPTPTVCQPYWWTNMRNLVGGVWQHRLINYSQHWSRHVVLLVEELWFCFSCGNTKLSWADYERYWSISP